MEGTEKAIFSVWNQAAVVEIRTVKTKNIC